MATSERELTFIISAQDQATAVLKQVGAEAHAAGAEMSAGLDQASEAMKHAAVANQRLTGFIREERAENRMQNFLFREGVGAISAVSTALTLFGGVTGVAKHDVETLTNSLNAGIAGFQGFSFAMSAIGVGSGIGAAIAAVGGLAIAFKSLSDETSKGSEGLNESITKYAELKVQLGEWSKAAVDAAVAVQRADLMVRLSEMQKSTTDWVKSMKNILSSLASPGGLFTTAFKRGLVVDKLVGTPKEIQDAMNAIAELDVKMQNLWSNQADAVNNAIGPNALKPIFNAWSTLDILFSETWARWKDSLDTVTGKIKEIPMVFDQGALDIGAQWATFFDMVQTGAMTTSQDMGEAFLSAFESIFGEANSMLERFFASIVEYVGRLAGQIAASAAIAGLLSLFTGGGLGFGAIFRVLTGGLFDTRSSGGGGSIGSEGSEGTQRVSAPIGGGGIASRIDSLAGAIVELANAPIVGTVNVDGGQLMLRREWGTFSRWNSKKTIS